MTRRVVLPIWCVLLAVALAALHLLGETDLGLPLSPSEWPAHLAEVGPASVIVGVIRLVALALAWYLVAVTVAGAVTRSVGRTRAVAVADAVTPRFLQRLLATAGGLAISGAGLAAATAPIAIGVDPAGSAREIPAAASVATMRQIPSVAVPSPSTAAWGDHRVEPASTSSGEHQPSSAEFSVLDLSGLGAALAAAEDAPTAETWTVDCGDHLWSIAEEVLIEAAGSQPAEETITDYWLMLIAANRDRLVAPSNPDLLLPGQVLVLPTPPSEP